MFGSLLFSISNSVKAQQVNATVFKDSIQNGHVQIFDVRTAGEYNTGHLSNALQADYTKKEEFTDRVKYLDKDQTVYIYCLSGGRSAKAASWMRDNGFKKVIELEGGINAWKQAGQPVEGATEVKQMAVDAFRSDIAKGEVLVDVGAEWCPPCRKMAPVLESYLSEHKTVRLLKVDGGRDQEVMQSIKATSLPTFILYKDGREVWRKQGVYEKL
ncbi:rhodanese-like domain-containing protein [Chitinophaga sp. YR627]|uniref:rhodanese-like domain-containing protein n=1 Tax=Chitinophaga sp. YR627 TaxID=1881041 RepID=UPI0015A5103C|nr:rhodanese-like domain-containing protein [Chitinophaga sp. YR627]